MQLTMNKIKYFFICIFIYCFSYTIFREVHALEKINSKKYFCELILIMLTLGLNYSIISFFIFLIILKITYNLNIFVLQFIAFFSGYFTLFLTYHLINRKLFLNDIYWNSQHYFAAGVASYVLFFYLKVFPSQLPVVPIKYSPIGASL